MWPLIGKFMMYLEVIYMRRLPSDLWIIDLLRLLYLFGCRPMFTKGPFRFGDGRFRRSTFGKALGMVRASYEHGAPMMVGRLEDEASLAEWDEVWITIALKKT